MIGNSKTALPGPLPGALSYKQHARKFQTAYKFPRRRLASREFYTGGLIFSMEIRFSEFQNSRMERTDKTPQDPQRSAKQQQQRL
jgi:hypothetical protein